MGGDEAEKQRSPARMTVKSCISLRWSGRCSAYSLDSVMGVI